MMIQKGEILGGLYNIKINNNWESCTRPINNNNNNNNNFIPLKSIINYDIKIFKNFNKQILNIWESLEVMETLNDNNTIKDYKDFKNKIKEYDILLANQSYIQYFLRSGYKIQNLEGILIKDKLIPIYLLPYNNNSIYLINLNDKNEIIDYKQYKKRL